MKVKYNYNTLSIDNTNDAINMGVLSSVRGGVIDCIVSGINKVLEINKSALTNINIIFTGGHSENIFKLCRSGIANNHIIKRYVKSIQYKYNLVIYGMERLYFARM